MRLVHLGLDLVDFGSVGARVRHRAVQLRLDVSALLPPLIYRFVVLTLTLVCLGGDGVGLETERARVLREEGFRFVCFLLHSGKEQAVVVGQVGLCTQQAVVLSSNTPNGNVFGADLCSAQN